MVVAHRRRGRPPCQQPRVAGWPGPAKALHTEALGSPKGPSTQYLRFLMAKQNIKGMMWLEPETSKLGYLEPLGGE